MDRNAQRRAAVSAGPADNQVDAAATGRAPQPVDLAAAITAIDALAAEVTTAVRELGDELVRHESAIEARLDDMLSALASDPPSTVTRGRAMAALRRWFDASTGDHAGHDDAGRDHGVDALGDGHGARHRRPNGYGRVQRSGAQDAGPGAAAGHDEAADITAAGASPPGAASAPPADRAPAPAGAAPPAAGRASSPAPAGAPPPAAASAPPPAVPPHDGDRDRHTIVAFCLQPFRLYVDDAAVTAWRGHRSQELLRVLLTRHPSPATRDELIDVFWPDADPESARRCLHQTVYRLRGTLRLAAGDHEIVRYRTSSYSLSDRVDVWTDADEFERLIVEGRRCEDRGEIATAMVRLATAETLYLDGYMQDHPYDDWCRERRDALHRTYVDVAAHLADLHTVQGDHATAILLSQRLLAHEPTHEAAYRRMMHSYIAQGHRHLAAAAYRQCEAVLGSELGLAPSPTTVTLFAQLGARS